MVALSNFIAALARTTLPVSRLYATADANTATFAGFLAEEDYPLAFIVIVEGGGAGSSVAAPVARSVLEACMNVLDGER